MTLPELYFSLAGIFSTSTSTSMLTFVWSFLIFKLAVGQKAVNDDISWVSSSRRAVEMCRLLNRCTQIEDCDSLKHVSGEQKAL